MRRTYYPTTTTTTTADLILLRMVTEEEISYDGSLLPSVNLLVIKMQTLLTIVNDHMDNDYVPPRPSKREPSILA